MSPRSIDELLAEARTKLRRLDPAGARAAVDDGGAVLIDIRSDAQRARDGVVPESIRIQRNVLEWRCDPASDWRDGRVAPDRTVIVMCDEGYQSSLAASALQDLGHPDATDLVGGFQAWREASR